MSLPVVNPRTGQVDYVLEPLDAAALADLVARMRRCQTTWASRTAEARALVLTQLADAIARHRAPLLAALEVDTGRSALSAIEVDGVIGALRRWAERAPGLLRQQQSANRPTGLATVTTSTRLAPYPLVGVISPWNFPLTLALIDAIPALAAGCAVLVKPSEVAPRFIRPLAAAIADVDALRCVLEVIEGDAATGAALVDRVDFVAFTGSVATGRDVAARAARAFIPASLELGGKDPMLVLASADPVKAAETALRASVVNSGQACQSIERIHVAREILAPFVAALVEKARAVRLNYPDMRVGDIGPFISVRQAEVVQAQIDDAVAQGARVLTGGRVETLGGGKYLRPTVLVDVTGAMKVMSEETFGPVLPVMPFDTIDEAIAQANDGMYGLSAAVLAATAEEAEEVAAGIRAGAVSINDGALTSIVWDAEKSSFGASGLGPSRMGESGLLRFVRKQAIIRQAGSALPLAAYAEDTPRA